MRFVRIYHNPKDDPGSRIRVDYDPENADVFCVADEDVFPEKTFDPDANHIRTLAQIDIDRLSARWLRDTLIDLCAHLDAEESASSAAGASP